MSNNYHSKKWEKKDECSKCSRCNSNCKTVNTLFDAVDNLSIPCNKPEIKSIIDVCVKTSKLNYEIVESCPGTNLVIKGYRMIQLCYETNCSCEKVCNLCFLAPIFESIPIDSCDNVVDVSSKICYTSADIVSNCQINVNSILSVDTQIVPKKCDRYDDCPNMDSILDAIRNMCYDNNFSSNSNCNCNCNNDCNFDNCMDCFGNLNL